MKSKTLKLAAFAATMLCTATLCSSISAQPAFQNKSLSSVERAKDLVSRLTLEEKASLMEFTSPAIPRLGIPAYNWWNECLHGVARNGEATVYPMPIGMAASFDPDFLYEIYTSVSDEARVKYLAALRDGSDDLQYKGLTFWTPNINIFRDPRWGRGMETYGEDPYLTGVMGSAVVRGIQGPDADKEGRLKAQACAKHYAVHSGPESLRHEYDANISERDLRETYLAAFKELVTKAGVGEVMFAYNSFQGKPCGASDRLIKDILRGEWGYKGIIVSDCWAVDDFYNGHAYVKTSEEAVADAVKTGMDVECGPNVRNLPQAVKLGLIDEATIDTSVVRLLAVRYELGQMDTDSPWDTAVPESALCSEEHAEQALKMAHETMTLLQNDGILPLKADAEYALIGPNAADSVMMWGNYNGFPLKTVTLYEALRARYPELKYIPDVPYVDGMFNDGFEGDGITARTSYSDTLAPYDVDALVKQLEGIETVIFAGGISPRLEGEEMPCAVPGFKGGDKTTIELPDVQRRIVAALAAAGKKVIFVNFSGSAVALAPEAKVCSAILQAWYPGQAGGTAIADVLYGDYNPCGKLPVTFYAEQSQLPDFEDYNMVNRTYRYFKGQPLFCFGHGLSYTTFKYRRARVKKMHDGTKALVVKVKNAGKMDGSETVQLYVTKPDDVNGPIQALRGFKKVFIKAGKSAKVIIPLTEDTFTWWNEASQNMEYTPSSYELHVGGSSDPAEQKTVAIKL